jgi:lipoprotein-anchoring transpeptidase ErfK/SrfK
VTEASTARVVCLLLARNCEEQLPGYFQSVGRFVDAVVALDDGSTDGTRAALQRQPLVDVLLDSPPRRGSDSDEGWARNALLEAATGVEPDWVVSIDAHERVPALDGLALRRFLETQALPGCAFGLERFRIDGECCYRCEDWTYRVFAFRPGQSFPGAAGCFDPVPTSVPPHAWVKTSFRLGQVATAGGHSAALFSRSPAEPLTAWLARGPVGPPLVDQPTSPYAPAISSGQLAVDSTLRLEIDRNQFALRLYRGLRIDRSYPVTVGVRHTPTPPGVFEVTSALYNPSWIVPRGELTGDVVGPEDPKNPIREHWLGLADGIGIHGTRFTRALRSPLSLGCVGMGPRDIVELYPHVPLGTPVVVL